MISAGQGPGKASPLCETVPKSPLPDAPGEAPGRHPRKLPNSDLERSYPAASSPRLSTLTAWGSHGESGHPASAEGQAGRSWGGSGAGSWLAPASWNPGLRPDRWRNRLYAPEPLVVCLSPPPGQTLLLAQPQVFAMEELSLPSLGGPGSTSTSSSVPHLPPL